MKGQIGQSNVCIMVQHVAWHMMAKIILFLAIHKRLTHRVSILEATLIARHEVTLETSETVLL